MIDGIATLPEAEAKNFYRWVAKAAEKYFEDPEVQRRFEEWKRERDAKCKEKTVS